MLICDKMKEYTIISLTTYSKRIFNIPTVLDTIFNQTHKPDFVVLNLAYDEIIPIEVQAYIESRPIEVNRVPDTKVFKKLIPTLKKYPNDVVISIDDDWLYPENMVEDFMTIHHQYPDYPISGNKSVFCCMQCHCGCASLQKGIFWGDFINVIDDDIIFNCASDDIVYTYISNMAGHPYIRTDGLYFHNMKAFNDVNGYSEMISDNCITQSYIYLLDRFGPINCLNSYPNNLYGKSIVNDIINKSNQKFLSSKQEIESICKSNSYKIGSFILRPAQFLLNKKTNNKR